MPETDDALHSVNAHQYPYQQSTTVLAGSLILPVTLNLCLALLPLHYECSEQYGKTFVT